MPPAPMPVEPSRPTSSETPTVQEVPAMPEQSKYVEGQKELPNTGTANHANLAALGLLGVLSGFGLVARKKKDD